jgi:hypothetical protein
MPWTRKPGTVSRSSRLSGQENAPMLILRDDEVVSGSGRIASWARANQPA